NEAETGGDELQWNLRQGAVHEADALPGIVPVVARGHCHVRAGGEVDGAEADAFHQRCSLHDLRRTQARHAPEALVAVADAYVYQFKACHAQLRSKGMRRGAWRENRCRRRPVRTRLRHTPMYAE